MPIYGHVRPDYVLPFFGHRLYLIPLMASLSLLAALLIPSVMTAGSDSTHSTVFVDDAFACGIEACIWSQLTNWASLLLALTFYLRYKVVRDFLVPDHCGSLLRGGSSMNASSLRVGLVAAACLFVAANFGEGQVYWVHMGSVRLGTSSLIVYWWLQTRWLEAHIDRFQHRIQRCLFYLTIFGMVLMRVSLWILPGDLFKDRNARECQLVVRVHSEFVPWLRAAAFGQWCSVFCLALLPLTFVGDFKIITQKLEEQAKWRY